MKKTLILALGMVMLTSPAMAHGPHEHGVARMDVAVDNAKVEISLESPLANAISFEHAPSSDAQRAEVQAMAAKLRQSDKIFLLTQAAQCRPAGVSLASEKLPPELLGEHSQATGKDEHAAKGHEESSKKEHAHTGKTHDESATEAHEGAEEHGDLDASFTFECAQPEALKDLDVQLFKAWPALHELKVQMVTPSGQKGAELTGKKHTLAW